MVMQHGLQNGVWQVIHNAQWILLQILFVQAGMFWATEHGSMLAETKLSRMVG
jgi:hypothetical protein